jgi:hypothetical protein
MTTAPIIKKVKIILRTFITTSNAIAYKKTKTAIYSYFVKKTKIPSNYLIRTSFKFWNINSLTAHKYM